MSATDERVINLPTARLSAERVSLAASKRRVFFAVLPDGTSLRSALEPAYWSVVAGAHRLAPLDRIEVVDDRCSFFAELMVTDVGPNGVLLKPLRGFELGDSVGSPGKAQRATGGERVRYAGPHKKWSIVASDGEVMQDGFATEALAMAALGDLLRARGR